MNSPGPLLLSVFPHFDVGGPQVRFASVINNHGLAWRHVIVSINGGTDCAERISPDLDVRFVNGGGVHGGLLTNLGVIRRMIKAIRPDVLMTHNWGSMEWVLANLTLGVRHVHVEDGFGPEERSRQIARRVMMRRMALRRSTVVLPSHTLMRIAREVWRLPAARLRYVPNGIDLTRFHPPAPGSRRAGPPCIGVVAALRPEKNLARLLRAVKVLVDEGQPLRLEIVGEGTERSSLEAQAADLGIAGIVDFLGGVRNPAEAYRGFDLFALSSDTEQMPLSVMEAMATGLPIVSTRVGDTERMLSAENQPFLCDLSDRAMAEALRPLLRDGALRSRVGEANRAKAVRDFDERTMFCAYADALTPKPTPRIISRPQLVSLLG